ncbi:hypothetical protein [Paenibacillus sacheonensis]|uniref:Uncharacterized protein n=1 Tax=Paenibacillus sacheonensis TaxID=742054 RepID=A0A7X4YU93_9BACL|nr:hypothetical protein [Paenibacillus sacheonensis]MBM7568944.1 uncharacterized protein involved in exopolysaccharide biosynthesis [Paenibacillus sacheonensis]NBC72682.1 hypothetical protein [Paenibacillus sacheonensis]
MRHTEDERRSLTEPKGPKKPSLGLILALLAVIALIIGSSFALAHAVVGEAFRRLGG